MEVVQDISGHSIEHVSLLASGGWVWSGWHIGSNKGGSVVSQLERGKSLWFFTTRTRVVKTLPLRRKRTVPPFERLCFMPTTLREDLLEFREHIVYCIQEPVILFSSLTAHCVLTEAGPAALMTTTLKVEEAEEERVQGLGAQF